MAGGDVEEHLAEEGEAAEHVRLVHAGDDAAAVERPAAATLGQAEGELDDLLGSLAGDDERVGRPDRPTTVPPPNEANSPSRFSRRMTKSMPGSRLSQRRSDAGVELDRPHGRVQAQRPPQADHHLRLDLGAVGDCGRRAGRSRPATRRRPGGSRRARRSGRRHAGPAVELGPGVALDRFDFQSGMRRDRGFDHASVAARITSGPMPSPGSVTIR